MLKKILIIIGVLLSILALGLTYSSIGCFVVGSNQPKIISIDGHTTFSWGYYTVGIVFSSITLLVIAILITYIILARYFYKKKINN